MTDANQSYIPHLSTLAVILFAGKVLVNLLIFLVDIIVLVSVWKYIVLSWVNA